MNTNIKVAAVVFMVIWMAVMGLDQFGLITWPDLRIKRIFVWAPTVIFGLYFLFFGGKSKDDDKKDAA